MSEKTLNLIKESEAGWVDLRFTDSRGKEQHVSIPSSEVDEDFFDGGKMFDGSSIAGWKGINESDMILMPDDSTSVLDPFTDDTTVILRCDIVEPSTMQGYERDPRSVDNGLRKQLQRIRERLESGQDPEQGGASICGEVTSQVSSLDSEYTSLVREIKLGQEKFIPHREVRSSCNYPRWMTDRLKN